MGTPHDVPDMAIARHGSGVRAELAAVTSQVHPVFMLPPVAVSLFGGVLTGDFSPSIAIVHAIAIFLAVYTAHVKDGYVDFYGRGEDDDHPMTERGCRLALAGSSVGFGLTLGVLWWLVDLGAALITLPAWLIAYHHAPQLDLNPVGATAGYPVGVGIALLGGYYVQTTSVGTVPLAFALVLVVLLLGVKIIDDETDYAYDRSIGKRTVAVALGPERARQVAVGCMILAMLGVIWFAALDVFPPGSVLAVIVFGAVATVAHRAEATLATMLLVRGCYVFLAVLVGAVWWQPLS